MVLEEIKQYYLSEAELFKDLSVEEVAQIGKLGQMEMVPRGKSLYSPGEPGNFFILKQGRVQLCQLSLEGRRIVLANVGEGNCFGEMSLQRGRLSNAFAQATEDSVVCIFSPESMGTLLERYPKVARRLLEVMGKRLAEVERRLEELTFKSVTTRLTNLLLELARSSSGEVVGFSHDELAETIGTYRETVTRVLGELESQGLLKVGRLRIQLLDVAGLRKVALR